ncbi:MAG TPA: hypothetical protein VLM79_09280 [Kofleriaceae bacterium]|nr:hypothetical protein [Kofleriaceae bacterium]
MVASLAIAGAAGISAIELLLDSVTLDLVDESTEWQTERLGGLGLIAVVLLQRAQDEIGLVAPPR